ncbi:MAG: carbohydrate kinase family protein [Fimbriimonadales bacterium]
MRRGVIAGGNFIVDYVKTIDHYPVEQTLADIRSEYTGSGGAPYNVLRCLTKLQAGLPLEAIGRIGEDEAGRYVMDDCRSLGIGIDQLRLTPGSPTSYTLVMVIEGDGRRTFFHRRGANAILAPGDFDFNATQAAHFHYGYVLLLDRMDEPDAEYGTGAARVIARAKEAGLTTSIDLVSEDSDRFGRIVPPALEYADIAFMNEFEASRLTGLGFETPSPDRVGEARKQLGFRGTLVVHWPEGAAFGSPDGELGWQGGVQIPQEMVASVAGSGDAFAAGYLLGFQRRDPPQECLRLGVCCAAACVMGYTCTDGVLSEQGCRLLGQRYGFRGCP